MNLKNSSFKNPGSARSRSKQHHFKRTFVLTTGRSSSNKRGYQTQRTEPNNWGSTFFTSAKHQDSGFLVKTFRTETTPKGYNSQRNGFRRSRNPFTMPLAPFSIENLKKESDLLSRRMKMVKAMDDENVFEEEEKVKWDEMSDESENEREYKRKMFELKHIKNSIPKLSKQAFT